MDNTKLGPVESRFADLIWEHAPLSSGELVRLCQQELGWKKPTTYTVLRKLCERGLFQNDHSTVTARISQAEYYAIQGEALVKEAFDGSLPAFLAAFTRRKALSPDEIREIRRMIDQAEEEAP